MNTNTQENVFRIGKVVENYKHNISYWKQQNDKLLSNIAPIINVRDMQHYIPIYEHFFQLSPTNYKKITIQTACYLKNISTVNGPPGQDTSNEFLNPTHGQSSSNPEDIVKRCYFQGHVVNKNNSKIEKKDLFVKYSPLLDPIKYLVGKYANEPNLKTLPQFVPGGDHKSHCKLTDRNNSSYVDGFFTFLSSQLKHAGFPHGIEFYGSFLGIQKKYCIDVTDDFDYIFESTFFQKNTGILFTVNFDHDKHPPVTHSSTNRDKLKIGSDPIDLLDILELDEFPQNYTPDSPKQNTIDGLATVNQLRHEIEDDDENETVWEDVSGSDSSSTDENNSDMNYSTDNEAEAGAGAETEIDDVESDDESSISSSTTYNNDVIANILDFPVQVIVMEKCDNTLDNLMESNIMTAEMWRSALFQIIMTLAVYQKCFKFVHNDLHTNNVMFSKTNVTHLSYDFDGIKYKIPTFGRIFKIIDFGRAIYTFNEKMICSDSFAEHGDASTQYNFPPFYDENKPIVEPNMGFDICRLGTSLFDYVNTNMENDQNFDKQLCALVELWCCDDNGKNMLYKKNGEERYPGFKLYKMIARHSTKHIPAKVLNYPYFAKFIEN